MRGTSSTPTGGKPRSTFSWSALASHSMTAVVLLVLLVVGGYHSYIICMDQQQDCRRKEAELRSVEQQIREVQVQNRILQRKRERLMTSEGVEEIAREKLGMVRRGEIAFVVEPGPPEAEVAEPVVVPAPPEPEPGPVESLLRRFLF